MLGARALRVLAGKETPGPSSKKKSSEVARLTPEQRCHQWKRITSKILLVVRNLEIKRTTQQILGVEQYRRIFRQIDQIESPAAPSQVVHRVINGEIVGQVLASTGKETSTDAFLCQHPIDAMKRRGNRTQSWWTCMRCQTRWERLPLPVQEGQPQDYDLVTFGKYVGRTYQEVYEDPPYSEWVLRTVESGETSQYPDMKRLALYLVQKEQKEADSSPEMGD